MNNKDLKKKIFDIVAMSISEAEDLPFVETAEYVVDALIAAGIGDVKDLQAQVNALEITNIALQAGYDGAEEDRLYWVDKYKEAEHRVEVVEHALRKFSVRIACKNCPFSEECNITPDRTNDYYDCFERYIKQAEKELAEERKDEN